MLFPNCGTSHPFASDVGEVGFGMTVLTAIKEMRFQLADGLLQLAFVRFPKPQTRIGLHLAQQLDHSKRREVRRQTVGWRLGFHSVNFPA